MYSWSLSAFVGLKDNLTAPRIFPLLNPAGEKKLSAILSVNAHSPAISPFNGTNLYTSEYLSYIYLYPLSKTMYDELGQVSNASVTFAVAVSEDAIPTVAERYGETNPTQSLRDSTNAVIIVT